MNDHCKHNNPNATCCRCLTERFRTFEYAAKIRREQHQNGGRVIPTTYHSDTLGRVTIPGRDD